MIAFVSLLLVAERSPDVGGSAIVAQAAVVVGSPRDRQLATSTRVQTEVFPLALFAVGGMMLFVVSNNLLLMFVALEVLSLPLYLMAGLARRRRLLSQEAAVKYFLLGAFASAFFLYGVALIYGYANSVDLATIANVTSQSGKSDVLLYSGLALLLVGLLFKAGIAPFHSWTPDVYQGSPTGDHRVHGLVHEGRGVRGDPAGALHRLPPHALGLEAGHLGRRDRLDGGRLDLRADPDRREARPGVLLDRARRLHPRRASRASPPTAHRRPRSRACCSTWSPTASPRSPPSAS